MNCMFRWLEYLGLYEPELSFKEAQDRLLDKEIEWEKYQGDRSDFWAEFQGQNVAPSVPLIDQAVRIQSYEGVHKVAVDLCSGITQSTLNLLEDGWKVIAVDSSQGILDQFAAKVRELGRDWIESGKLELVHCKVEDYKFPQNVTLITASDALPYCRPTAIYDIFRRIETSLSTTGLFVGNFFAAGNYFADLILEQQFGAWITTKNVIDAIVKDANLFGITQYGKSRSNIAPQIHLICCKKTASKL